LTTPFGYNVIVKGIPLVSVIADNVIQSQGIIGQEYGKNISHPLLSITLTITLSATSNGGGTSNVNVGGIVVEPVIK
jgi:hypothetical protein